MQGQNNWRNWGSPDVMKLWVAWEVLRWLMKFRELCSGGFIRSWLRHPTTVSSMWTLPQIVKIQNGTKVQRNTQVPVGKHNNRQHASPHHEVAIDVKQMPIRPIIIILYYYITFILKLADLSIWLIIVGANIQLRWIGFDYESHREMAAHK